MTQRFSILGNDIQAGTKPLLQFINLSQMTQKTQKKNIREICEKLFSSPMVYRHPKNLSQMTEKRQKKNIRDISEFCEKLFSSPMVYHHFVLSPAGYLFSKLIPSSLNGFIQISDEKYFQKIKD